MRLTILIILISLTTYIYSTTYKYQDIKDGKISNRIVKIKDFKGGYIVDTITKDLKITSILDKELVLIEQTTLNLLNNSRESIKVLGNELFHNGNSLGKFNSKKLLPRSNAEFVKPWLKENTKVLKFIGVNNKRDKDGNAIDGVMDKYKLYLKRLGREYITIDGESFKTVKVLFTIDNPFLSMFWKTHHWYRESDGILLKYETVKVPPGESMSKGRLTDIIP